MKALSDNVVVAAFVGGLYPASRTISTLAGTFAPGCKYTGGFC